MKRRLELIAAPPSIQPGGYVREAYADHTVARTPLLDVSIEPRGAGWEIFLAWPCAAASQRTTHDVNLFTDAAAILAPSQPDAPMITMGNEVAGVDGWLWMANREDSLRIHARGLGTVERSPAAGDVRVSAAWLDGRWGVKFELTDWESLDRLSQIGFAIWQGTDAERAGLKSVTPNWVTLQ